MITLEQILNESKNNKYLMPINVFVIFVKVILDGNDEDYEKFLNLFKAECTDYIPSTTKILYRGLHKDELKITKSIVKYSSLISSWTESYEFAKEWADNFSPDHVVISYIPNNKQILVKTKDIDISFIKQRKYRNILWKQKINLMDIDTFISIINREEEVILQNLNNIQVNMEYKQE